MSDKLTKLHDLLTNEMIKQLKANPGEVPAAVLSAVSKFLKDNHFEAEAGEGPANDLDVLLQRAKDSLPDHEAL